MTQTSDELQQQVVALIKQSADLKMYAQDLLRQADELRHKAEGLKDAIEKSKAEPT